MSEEQGKKDLRDKDVFFGILLLLFSCGLIVYSMRISFAAMKLMGCKFYVAPGLMPLAIGFMLFILAGSLVRTALKQGGDLKWLLPENLIQIVRKKDFWQTITAFACFFIYIFILWDRIPIIKLHIPFWLATFIFLTTIMGVFRATRLPYILIISGATTFLVDYCFRVLARIPLP